MSSQPTDTQKAKDAAANTIQSVSNTLTGVSNDPRSQPNYDEDKDPRNFDTDAHGNTFKKGDFKDQLNRAATSSTSSSDASIGASGGEGKGKDGIVETIKSYIPGLAAPKDQSKPEVGDGTIAPGVPPERPDHDVQVEQFLRKQYHSRAGDGMPDPSKE